MNEDNNIQTHFKKIYYPIPFTTDDSIQDLHHTFAGTVCEKYEFWITVIRVQTNEPLQLTW